MQKRLLKVAADSTGAAINALEALKSVDIKSRKAAKASAKPKWTQRIDDTTKAIEALRASRAVVKSLPKRVA